MSLDTIDWIEDSILERSRRLREARDVYASSRTANGRITLQWLISQVRQVVVASQSWFVVSIVGAGIGMNAAIISIITEWLSDMKMGYCSDGWWLNQQFCCWELEVDEDSACDAWHLWSTVTVARWFIYVLFAATFSFLASHLVRSLAKYAAGSGISEIKCILSGFVMQGFLGFWTFLIKSLTLPLVIASGLSVGKEGPSVHVACTIGNLVASQFGRFSRSQSKMRDILTAASAAGVAVAFGSPIGGVMFSIEVRSSSYGNCDTIGLCWDKVQSLMADTLLHQAMNPFRTGKLVMFQVTYNRDWHFFEIMFFVILGIFGGLYGAFVIKFNMQVASFRRKHLGKHGVAEAVTLATITAMIGYFNRFLRIDMTESMSILFRECEDGGDFENLCQTSAQWRMVNSLLLATFIRILLVIVSYGCKVPAGIFVPSMAIGATFGRMVGIIVKALYRAHPSSGIFAVCQPDVPCITPGTYAFLGAAAALSGVMRITVTVVVIMFELTGALTYILPTMIVLLVTKAVGDVLGVRGIADEAIRFNGYPFLEKDDHVYDAPDSDTGRIRGVPRATQCYQACLIGDPRPSKTAPDLPPDTLCTFSPDPAEQPDARWSAIGSDEDMESNVRYAVATPGILKLWPWVNQTPLTVSSKMPLEVVMQVFKRMGPRVILVEDFGALVGLTSVKDVLHLEPYEQLNSPIVAWSNRGALDGALEELWTWLANVQSSINAWYGHASRRWR
ncbi:voltage-gated chloride channel [Lactarius pseudohatsudake]|nr:voltage-gated chloride channel [Lactarius pseudohatsudake]